MANSREVIENAIDAAGYCRDDAMYISTLLRQAFSHGMFNDVAPIITTALAIERVGASGPVAAVAEAIQYLQPQFGGTLESYMARLNIWAIAEPKRDYSRQVERLQSIIDEIS